METTKVQILEARQLVYKFEADLENHKRKIEDTLKNAVADYLTVNGPVHTPGQWQDKFTLEEWNADDVDYEVSESHERSHPWAKLDDWEINVYRTTVDDRYGDTYSLTIKLSEVLSPNWIENIKREAAKRNAEEVARKKAQLKRLQDELGANA